MKLAVGIHFSFSSSLSGVVDVSGLLTRKILSAGRENFRKMGLTGSAESTLYVVGCWIQPVGVLDGDSACHEEGTGLEVVRSSSI